VEPLRRGQFHSASDRRNLKTASDHGCRWTGHAAFLLQGRAIRLLARQRHALLSKLLARCRGLPFVRIWRTAQLRRSSAILNHDLQTTLICGHTVGDPGVQCGATAPGRVSERSWYGMNVAADVVSQTSAALDGRGPATAYNGVEQLFQTRSAGQPCCMFYIRSQLCLKY
jgi:hypothetical protein